MIHDQSETIDEVDTVELLYHMARKFCGLFKKFSVNFRISLTKISIEFLIKVVKFNFVINKEP